MFGPRIDQMYQSAVLNLHKFDVDQSRLSEMPFLASDPIFVRCEEARVSEETFLKEYIQPNQPGLFRGLIDDWKAFQHWTREQFVERYGKTEVDVSRVAYSEHFGAPAERMTLRKYVEEEMTLARSAPGDSAVGARRYVFTVSAATVGLGCCRDDLTVDCCGQEIARDHPLRDDFSMDWIDRRFTAGSVPELFIGAAGSGAQVHRHDGAINALVYGVKHWYLFPPTQRKFAPDAFGMPVDEWVEQILPQLRQGGIAPIEFIQSAGEVVFVPHDWAHVIVNLADVVGVSAQLKMDIPLVADLMKVSVSEERPNGVVPGLEALLV